MTQEGSGSGALSAHCQTWHDEIYRQACETSMHTRLQQRDGALVKIYTFDEAFDRHVSFAVETYLDYAPPRRSRRPGHRQHSANLDPRYTPPSQVTTERIIMVIDELMTEELVQLIVQQRTEVRRIGRRRRRSVVVGRRSRGVAVHDLGSFKACAHRDRSVGRRSSSVVVGRRRRRLRTHLTSHHPIPRAARVFCRSAAPLSASRATP